MHRYAQKLHQLIRSLLLLSVITATGAQAAEKIDLIIDTDPGATTWSPCCLPWPPQRS